MATLADFFRRSRFPAARAPRIVSGGYRLHEMNECAGCGGRCWIVGRRLAECADCATAVPLAETGLLGSGRIRRGRRAALMA